MTHVWRSALPCFPSEELASPDTGEIYLDPRFAAALVALRWYYDRPMLPTSCCRTPAHNQAVGGHPRSLHLTEPAHVHARGTMAIDVRAGGDRVGLLQLAWDLGWSIIVGRTTDHLDRRGDIGLPRAAMAYPQADERVVGYMMRWTGPNWRDAPVRILRDER